MLKSDNRRKAETLERLVDQEERGPRVGNLWCSLAERSAVTEITEDKRH